MSAGVPRKRGEGNVCSRASSECPSVTEAMQRPRPAAIRLRCQALQRRSRPSLVCSGAALIFPNPSSAPRREAAGESSIRQIKNAPDHEDGQRAYVNGFYTAHVPSRSDGNCSSGRKQTARRVCLTPLPPSGWPSCATCIPPGSGPGWRMAATHFVTELRGGFGGYPSLRAVMACEGA